MVANSSDNSQSEPEILEQIVDHFTNRLRAGEHPAIADYQAQHPEFKDEIDAWVIEEFRKVGLDTAKSVLELNAEDLIKRTDLEEETVLDVLKILKEEFED